MTVPTAENIAKLKPFIPVHHIDIDFNEPEVALQMLEAPFVDIAAGYLTMEIVETEAMLVLGWLSKRVVERDTYRRAYADFERNPNVNDRPDDTAPWRLVLTDGEGKTLGEHVLRNAMVENAGIGTTVPKPIDNKARAQEAEDRLPVAAWKIRVTFDTSG